MPKASPRKISTSAPQGVSPLNFDPIFDAIVTHKIAHQEHNHAVELHSILEQELAPEVCRTLITACSRDIVATDDPRWIAAEKRVDKTSDAEAEAANAILAVTPRTLRGAIALLAYAADHVDAGGIWTGDPEGGDHDWSFQLHKMLAGALAHMLSSGEKNGNR